MKVNVNTPGKNININNSQTNPQPITQPINNIKVSQTRNSQTQNNTLSVDELYQLLQQQLQKQQNPQQGDTGEFIVKSHMKASFVALKVEQILLLRKTAMTSAVGYAIPIALDSVFLIKKDLARMGKDVAISFELFEKQFTQKTVTGLRITLKLQ
jgi:hypothetical protein